MVQDTGGRATEGLEGKRIDSDPGWQSYHEGLRKAGRRGKEVGDLYFIYHMEPREKFDTNYLGMVQDGEYPEIDQVFIGDDFKLFEITDLIEDGRFRDIETLSLFLEADLEEEE